MPAQDTLTAFQRIYSHGDSHWSYTLNDADVVLKVKVRSHAYVTERGFFTCEVMEVMKGAFEDSVMNFSIEMIESSADRYLNRFDAIDDRELPHTVYIGLVEAWKNEYSDIADKKGNKQYQFFMSSKLYNH
jgi:hypothetical protein